VFLVTGDNRLIVEGGTPAGAAAAARDGRRCSGEQVSPGHGPIRSQGLVRCTQPSCRLKLLSQIRPTTTVNIHRSAQPSRFDNFRGNHCLSSRVCKSARDQKAGMQNVVAMDRHGRCSVFNHSRRAVSEGVRGVPTDQSHEAGDCRLLAKHDPRGVGKARPSRNPAPTLAAACP